MLKLIEYLDQLNPGTLQFLGSLVTGLSGVIGVIVVAVVTRIIAGRWLSARDHQDREVEWRNHAIALAKLDLERHKRNRENPYEPKLRPSILDFLANYRDLQELGERPIKDLYEDINKKRTVRIEKDSKGRS